MPREVVVLSKRPFDQADPALVQPPLARGLNARSMQNGQVIQWCRPDGTAVLSLLGPRGMDYPQLAAPQLGFAPEPDELFWCEGAVPYGPDSAVGIDVLREMATLVEGRVWVGGEL